MSAVPTTGMVILYSNRIKQDFAGDALLKESFEELINLIQVQIQDKNITDVSTNMFRHVFDFRIDLINWLSKEKVSSEKYFNGNNDYLQADTFPLLAKAVADVLSAYQRIITSVYQKGNIKNFEVISDIPKNHNRPTYESVFFLASSHPSPQVKGIKNCIDESLKFDIGLLIADLILTGEIHFNQKRIKEELIPFLRTSIDNFGAYCLFTGFWQPDKNDLSASTSKMKVIADVIRSKNGIKGQIIENVDDLYDIGLALAMEEVKEDKEYVDVEDFLKKLEE